MTKTALAAFLTIAIVLTLTPSAVAQTGDRTMPMRTPDGQPDVSGTFTFRTLTPFQRPDQFADQETLSLEDAAAFEASDSPVIRAYFDLMPVLHARDARPALVEGTL